MGGGSVELGASRRQRICASGYWGWQDEPLLHAPSVDERKQFSVRERFKLEDGERKTRYLKYMRLCAFEIVGMVMHPELRQRMTGGRQQKLSHIARVHVNRYQKGGPECN
jgi:hypothetical protein